jgi:hypothetical protein
MAHIGSPGRRHSPAALVTGTGIDAEDLTEGDYLHLEPHEVDGRVVGHGELDAEMEDIRIVDTTHIVVDWRGTPRFRGGSRHRSGCAVYKRHESGCSGTNSWRQMSSTRPGL